MKQRDFVALLAAKGYTKKDAKQIVELMPNVGMYAFITVEDEQQAIPLDCEAEYEQPIEGQTEIEVDGEEEDIFEPVVMSLPEPALPEGEEE